MPDVIGEDSGSVRRIQGTAKRVQFEESSFDCRRGRSLPGPPTQRNWPDVVASKACVFAKKFDRPNAQTLRDVNHIANLQGRIAEAFIDPQHLELGIGPKRQVTPMPHAIGTESKSTHMRSLLPAKHPSVPAVTPTKPTFGHPIQEFPVGHYRL
jgi:hypothetical protein